MTVSLNKYFNSDEVWAASLEPTGFPNRTDNQISFVSGTRVFTLEPSNGSFTYWLRGVERRVTSALTVTIADTTGLHFIVINSVGALEESTILWGYSDNEVMVATIYWRAGGNDELIGDERHGLTMDWSTHEYLHFTVGTAFEEGLTGTFNDNNTFTITAGKIHDQDIVHSISEQTTARILYRDGVTGTWFFDASGTDYFKETAGIIQYDNNGVLTDVSNGSHVAYWAFAVNDPIDHIYLIVGQRQDTTLANATATSLGLTNPLGTAFGGLATTSLPIDNQMLVSNGSIYAFSTIPACNTSTEKLIFATTTKTWSCQTDAGAGGGITDWAGLSDTDIKVFTEDDTNVTLT
ncbi:hypothetical protein LCGC14_1902720, partial [marine sediment metagenome]